MNVFGVPRKYISANELMPDRWFWYGTIWNGDVDADGRALAYDAMILRLPSWGMLYDICRDEFRWGQRVLLWHGKRGFRIAARFED